MRSYIRVVTGTLMLLVLAGCQPGASRQYLVVGFESGQELRYRFVSERDTKIIISMPATVERKAKIQTQTMTEKMELVMSYVPGPADEYGRTKIRAKCLSAKVTRKDFGGKSGARDAVEGLAGKAFEFTVSATGQIEEDSSIDVLVKELGKAAFAAPRGGRKVKNSDMINDFIAMQYHLWDSVGKIDNPRKGVKVGQTWQTKQLMPVSMPMTLARRTSYTLSQVNETETGPVAIIDSSYERINEVIEGLPVPYESGYMAKGMFVIMSNYKPIGFQGGGRQVFNIDRGVIESDEQNYKMEFQVSFPLPLGDTVPKLRLDQKMTIQLLDK